jgi:16S rRNA (guanine527-N7)-methyltransferase
MEAVLQHFPDLTPHQVKQYEMLLPLYADWNSKINVISRKDIDNFYEHHVLHSLAIAKYLRFKDATKVMDLGTGGGFPGIPLAIFYPNCRFHLVDSIGKKLNVVKAVAEAIGLENVFTFHSRAEEMKYQYDFVVSRAVAPVADLLKWTKGKYLPKSQNVIPNGLICLKGGNLLEELNGIRTLANIPLAKWYANPFFQEKVLIHVKSSF